MDSENRCSISQKWMSNDPKQCPHGLRLEPQTSIQESNSSNNLLKASREQAMGGPFLALQGIKMGAWCPGVRW